MFEVATDLPETTAWLTAGSTGDAEALHAVLPLVYDDLRRRASKYLRRERPDHTLETSALVHELYLRLADQQRAQWRSREHFLATASHLMRRILVDHARRRAVAKRGGGLEPLTLDSAATLVIAQDPRLVALDVAMNALATVDADLARVVEMRFFGGLSNDEIAVVLEVSERTVIRRWRLAQAWLHRHLEGTDEP